MSSEFEKARDARDGEAYRIAQAKRLMLACGGTENEDGTFHMPEDWQDKLDTLPADQPEIFDAEGKVIP